MPNPSTGTVGAYYPIPPLPPPPIPSTSSKSPSSPQKTSSLPSPYTFHFLEVTFISAQDLFPAVRSSMRTYAVAFINPDNKFRTRLDPVGHTDPTWNDKYLFRIDDATLRSETSAITVEIYAVRSKLLPGSDTLLGTARALLSTLQPTTTSTSSRFVALQVRRPSLRPQGLLNLGVTLVDTHAKSMPLRAENVKAKEPMKASNGNVAVKMVRSKSMRMLEKKLEMWREELPMARGEGSRGEKKKDRTEKPVSRRTAGRKSCFCVEPEVHEEGGEGRRIGHS